MKKRLFTLLELMLGIALLMLAGGAVSWNVHKAIQKYRFQSEVSRLEIQLQSCHRLALNSSADWKFHLTRSPTHLRVQILSLQSPFPPPKPLLLSPLNITFNGEEADQLSIYFSPTGRIEPKGTLELSLGTHHQEIALSKLFRMRELPDKEGPMHPNDTASTPSF